jgi:hypothetical protein
MLTARGATTLLLEIGDPVWRTATLALYGQALQAHDGFFDLFALLPKVGENLGHVH